MKLELEEIANGFEVHFVTNAYQNEYYKYYKTEKKALKAMSRAIDRYRRKREF